MPAPLSPSASLLCKLGSVLVHADEMLQPHAHAFDKTTLQGLIDDPEIKEWRSAMDAMAMLPKMRKGFERKPGR